MELIVDENSYVTVVEADEFIHAFFMETEEIFTWWESLSLDQQTAYLIRSARNIESLPFTGFPTSQLQELEFPRNGSTEVPQEVKEAQIVNAHFVATHTPDPIRQRKVKKYTIDNISEEFFATQSDIVDLCSFEVHRILSKWLSGGFRII